MEISITHRNLHFKQPATTSRGVYTHHLSYYIKVERTQADGTTVSGVGEASVLPDLSIDAMPVERYEQTLVEVCRMVKHTGSIPYAMLRPYPSILFALETAFAQLDAGGSAAFFDTPFARGEEPITINGLVWMGNYEEMEKRMEEKLELGFRCVKLKIGAIDFENELELLRRLRKRFSRNTVELRVDANGAFTPANAMERLTALTPFDIHSIEQPIRQGQWEEMAQLCQQSPLPIALDEELIGVNIKEMKAKLLDTIKPHYLVLKPSLHGGMAGTREWVAMARERHVNSWITSALESNIGLNAVAQLCADIYGPHVVMPQGLGTGQLYTNNVEAALALEGDLMWCTAHKTD